MALTETICYTWYMKTKMKSKKQVGFLLSNKVSPLTNKQKTTLKTELHKGKVKVKK